VIASIATAVGAYDAAALAAFAGGFSGGGEDELAFDVVLAAVEAGVDGAFLQEGARKAEIEAGFAAAGCGVA